MVVMNSGLAMQNVADTKGVCAIFCQAKSARLATCSVLSLAYMAVPITEGDRQAATNVDCMASLALAPPETA